MIQSRTLSSIVILSIFLSSLLVGCSGAGETTNSDVSLISAEAAFFSQLSLLDNQYNFTSFEAVDLSMLSEGIAEESVIWKPASGEIQYIDGLAILQNESLFLEFSFDQSLSELENIFYFVLAPQVDEGSAQQAFISQDGLSLMDAGLPAGNVVFQNDFEWQAGTRYGMFIDRTDKGNLRIKVWDFENLDRAAELITDQELLIGDSSQFGLKLDGSQSLTIHAMWKMNHQDDSSTQSQVVDDEISTQTDTPAAITGYPVMDSFTVDSLACDGKSKGEDGTFLWMAMASEHCDLTMKVGEALSFDFVMANPVNGQSRLSFIMLDANQEPSDMPVKGLGIPLANDKVIGKMDGGEIAYVEINGAIEIDGGRLYSALIVMNEYNNFEVQLWPADNPDTTLSVVLNDQNIPPDWLPVDDEEWVFGMWVADDQEVTISNMVHYTLGSVPEPVDEGSSVNEDQAAQLDSNEDFEWEDKELGGMGDFFIPGFDSYDEITCNDDQVFTQGKIDLPILAENITHDCHVDLPEGSGLIFEVAYNRETPVEQDAHIFDLAFSLGQGEDQKVIRYIPNNIDLIMKDNNNNYEFPMNGELVWEPEQTYTIVFISVYDKHVLIWPSDDPGQVIEGVITGKDWESKFGNQDPGQDWQLRVWQGAGVDLTIKNIAHFEAH